MPGAVAQLSAQTMGELLDELGLRALVGEAVRAHGVPLARAFVNSPQFASLAPQ